MVRLRRYWQLFQAGDCYAGEWFVSVVDERSDHVLSAGAADDDKKLLRERPVDAADDLGHGLEVRLARYRRTAGVGVPHPDGPGRVSRSLPHGCGCFVDACRAA